MASTHLLKILCLVLLHYYSFAVPVDHLHDGCQHYCTTQGICKVVQFNENCYYVFAKNKMTWYGSGELCMSHGMTMIQLQDSVTDNGLTSKIQDLFKDLETGLYIWLGGKAMNLNSWTFINNVTVNETSVNQPSKLLDGQQHHVCGTVHDDLTIDKDNCHNLHPFICRFDDWHGIPSYSISEAPANWNDARSRCQELHGDLFYLKNGENIEFLKRKLQPFFNETFFIGLTLRSWQWKDGQEILHHNWGDMELNELSEECLVVDPSTGQWNSMDCNARLIPFCRAAAIVPDVDNSVEKPKLSTKSMPSTFADYTTTQSDTDSWTGAANTSLATAMKRKTVKTGNGPVVVAMILIMVAPPMLIAVVVVTYRRFKKQPSEHGSDSQEADGSADEDDEDKIMFPLHTATYEKLRRSADLAQLELLMKQFPELAQNSNGPHLPPPEQDGSAEFPLVQNSARDDDDENQAPPDASDSRPR